MRRPALWLLAACAIPIGWLASHHASLRIDARNESLKSVSTRAAVDLRAMERAFGREECLLLGITAEPTLEIDAAEQMAIDRAVARLTDRTDVLAVRIVPTLDRDFRCLRVALRPETDTDAVIDEVRGALPPTLTLESTGPVLAENAIATALASERQHIVPIIIGAMIALLLAIYRSVRVAFLVIVPAAAAVVCTGGLFDVLGHALDPVSTLMDPVVLTVGIAMNVHVAESYLRHRQLCSAIEALSRTRAEVAKPTALSALTTIAGFQALGTSPIPAVARFGAYSSLGVAIVALIALACLPVWLAAAVGPSRRAPSRAHARYIGWLVHNRARIIASAAVAGAISVMALPDVKLDNDPLLILSANSGFRAQHDTLVRRLGAAETFDLWTPSANATPELPAVLTAIATEQEPLVLGPGAPPLRSAIDGSLLQGFVLAPSGSDAREKLFDRLEDRLADHGLAQVRVVGSAVQIARDSGELIRSQLASWTLVVPLLGLVVGIGLRSFRLALVSLIPNVLPALILYGGLAWARQPLSVATVMIGSAMMAVIVDDTIHLLHHYVGERRAGLGRPASIRTALQRAARAMTTTSAVLALGLGAGAFGELETTVEFSVLAAGTVALAWVFDIVLLPALLLGPRRRSSHRSPIEACPVPSTS